MQVLCSYFWHGPGIQHSQFGADQLLPAKTKMERGVVVGVGGWGGGGGGELRVVVRDRRSACQFSLFVASPQCQSHFLAASSLPSTE